MSEKLRVSKRYRLSKKEARRIREKVLLLYKGIPVELESIEVAEYKGIRIYISDRLPCLFELEGSLFPTLLCLLKRDSSWMPGITIDRGATNAVSRGADLMLPGIREVKGSFKKGDAVAAFDKEKGVPVMIGRALLSSEEIEESISNHLKGRAVENLHYAGDTVWRLCLSL
ncbi:MAG: DUF1947 domain-containing protein [Caldisphaeraceae archaeon]|nr:DUF1947 domain-containing protein [Caldisphaeraceae archaeon]MEB3692029.1 DUF1947 domain-containing protein [Caldisphaeraceae archaeon]MEB3797389.1 DUF1947 domain-containing protein [Caldisphaeraceae archaeon]